ncbi:FKBP-type peptidyl-prolyl cis-trans isomerase [Cellulomonas dongxiuzhuiae]|uniref:peptidylprolyl isomerase n=1 Tax=Cellulomonas dongxiuzhuiae TaxID=2819979 RepID=A0ABX8GIR6_9CELL|nr:FKBP-type peptidyl-prolyl cis-trans isomerase [Cellulomonas dongxiuzhuiae]MBO3089467.1 FKBP-type peptidyl-prolyl cis-trans isomerase [Cellulomonas dongxiuzhuiae]QWC15800.1 FKBP-type peptidyl-prolyl cis-trans isomerase [Cellulomonas dongxiuzhuiae]
MRRPTTRTALRAAAAALALSLTLAACAGDGGSDDPTTPAAEESAAPEGAPTATAEDIAALEAVTVEGAAGSEPKATLPTTPFTVSAAVARVLDEGTGDVIADGDLVDLHSVWVDGKDGATLSSTWTAGAPEQIVVSEASLAPVLTDILVGGKVGTRFAFAVPSGEDTSSLAIAEVSAKRPGRADGTAVAPADGLPTVTLAENGAPSLEAASGDAPTTLTVQPLIEGSGPEVAAGQTALVHYTGWLWDGTQFDSSWERSTPFPVENIGQAAVIAGWNEGLVGQKVGSQVMLVVPPDKGYGDEEKEGIPPGSTLVFVVDILAAS